MTRLFTKRPLAVLVWMAGVVCPIAASAQAPAHSFFKPLTNQLASVAQAELRGVVRDERSQPLANAVISAIGETSAFAVSDRNGRFTLRDLPAGPYLVRAHLQGYVPARARMVQILTSTPEISIALTRLQVGSETPQVLQAGVGGPEPVDDSSSAAQDRWSCKRPT